MCGCKRVLFYFVWCLLFFPPRQSHAWHGHVRGERAGGFSVVACSTNGRGVVVVVVLTIIAGMRCYQHRMRSKGEDLLCWHRSWRYGMRRVCLLPVVMMVMVVLVLVPGGAGGVVTIMLPISCVQKLLHFARSFCLLSRVGAAVGNPFHSASRSYNTLLSPHTKYIVYRRQ